MNPLSIVAPLAGMLQAFAEGRVKKFERKYIDLVFDLENKLLVERSRPYNERDDVKIERLMNEQKIAADAAHASMELNSVTNK